MFKSREAKRAYDRRYRAENREAIKHRQRAAKKARNHEQSRQWKRDHPGYAASYAKRTYHETRQRLYGILGLVCVGCGHSDIRVLEFDHIKDDGAIDRKRFSGARSMLDYYVRNPEEACENLQVLCRNCNWLKRKGDEWRTAKAGGDELDGQHWHEFPVGMVGTQEVPA